ncbi:MAG: hypothetical protein QG656_933, partial [Candidatus Hydrogenedentes bacterium]|nr:hypothetical protein [Candidatus Hydrogenedentota bacterium]
ELAPWALTVMAQNGRAVYPQEPFIPHTEYLLAARPMVLWHYTKLNDPRWTWNEKYIQLRQDPKATSPQKVGLMNKQGWAAYTLGEVVFIKRFAFDPAATYPDHGCNNETFTNEDMIEVESVGPMTKLAASGGTVTHDENWFLFKAEIGTEEAELDSKLMPLVKQTEAAMK